jgi:hypothetical protein
MYSIKARENSFIYLFITQKNRRFGFRASLSKTIVNSNKIN